MKRAEGYVRVILLIAFCLVSRNLFSASIRSSASDIERDGKSNLSKAMELLDNSLEIYFPNNSHFMHRFHNPFVANQSKERASVWMYTSAIEALNAVLKQLKKTKDWNVEGTYHNRCYKRYLSRLELLYDNLKYYRGSFDLVSYTQKKNWTVYAVDAVEHANHANVTGVLNVYDDQMWLINELIDSYHITGNKNYLKEAEYLTEYVLDGWDLTLNDLGEEYGGIPWGPGYVTKHACSNGPMVSPLVELHKIYKKSNDSIVKHYIDKGDKVTRLNSKVLKKDYYLDYATKIYDWQKRLLLNKAGVYDDMLGGCSPDCEVRYEVIKGNTYRKHTALLEATGRAYSYNSGTMLSGAADLFEETKERKYLNDLMKLSDHSFDYFFKSNADIDGFYSLDSDGFNNWFNTVLLKGYVRSSKFYNKASNYSKVFEDNLNYGYANYLKEGMLPVNLLKGWKPLDKDNQIEGMFMFSYVVQYALLNN